MRLSRALIAGAAIVLIVAMGAAWWLYASRDAIIKRAIESYGPQVTGVSVKVGSVKLEPLDGRGAIKRLEVGNPKGFTAPHALSLGEMRLALDPASLAADVVHIREVSLEAPSISYERGANGDNLSAIQKHIESHLPKGTSGPERKFIIDHVQVRKARVSYGGAVSVDVPDLQLSDLGKKAGGATAAEITREIWTALTRQALAAAPASIRGLQERAKGAVESLKGILK